MDVDFIDVCGVPTKIVTLGNRLGEKFDKKEIVLFITGNPGLCDFYITFLTTLYKFLQGNVPVWIIGHAGHDEPEDRKHRIPRLKHNKQLYNMDGQINHKVEFIRKYIPSDVKIHLVGHSIGAYISLKLLDIGDIGNRIQRCYLLFPTIEYMAESPNGKLYTSLVQRYFKIIYYLARFLHILPTILQNLLIMIFFWVRSIPSEFLESALMYIRPSVLSKIIYMATDEMEKVKEPDYALIEKNKHRLTFFYSTTDGWTPITYYERLIGRIPEINAQLTDKYDHAFVLKSSANMGALVAEWIQQHSAQI
ncbi:lipid droplet-associated hydrolase [Sitodiplosis mosellana]|uniref:lipid droplet-associated hydrolase n=1 Tax=Sitodiplosis mosellana TaxID=263140 RepID=UPI0024437EE3|nr:lipid droplet-associated hydrolase [Sitodiplosis mosellana]